MPLRVVKGIPKDWSTKYTCTWGGGAYGRRMAAGVSSVENRRYEPGQANKGQILKVSRSPAVMFIQYPKCRVGLSAEE